MNNSSTSLRNSLCVRGMALLGLLVSMASCGIFQTTERHIPSDTTPNDILLIGTYTDASSEGVYSFSIDVKALQADHIGTFKSPNPSYLTLDEKRSILFMVNETEDQPSVTAAKMDRMTGELKKINTTPTLGKSPAYITYNDGAVVTANYGGGSITLIEVNKDGSLGTPDWRIELGKEGESHPHATVFQPGAQWLYVTDLGQDKIFRFNYRKKVPPLTIDSNVTSLPKGSGPRHIIFDRQGKYAYLVNELKPSVVVFSVSDQGLEQIQEVSTDTRSARGGGHIALSPDGRFLYTSHRIQGDGIVVFKVDPNSGKLTRIGFTPTGKHPRHFSFSPDGKYIAVACKDASSIEFYQRDLNTGLLTKKEMRIQVSHPAFVLWHKAR